MFHQMIVFVLQIANGSRTAATVSFTAVSIHSFRADLMAMHSDTDTNTAIDSTSTSTTSIQRSEYETSHESKHCCQNRYGLILT